MNLQDFSQAAQYGIETAIWVTAPSLLLGLAVGFAVSIFQAATQINDQALAFIPKIGALVLGLIVFGPFMLSRLMEFTVWTFTRIASIN